MRRETCLTFRVDRDVTCTTSLLDGEDNLRRSRKKVRTRTLQILGRILCHQVFDLRNGNQASVGADKCQRRLSSTNQFWFASQAVANCTAS